MRMPGLLRRLLRRGDDRSNAEQDRYDEATRTEERTQEHYRSVTETDSRGRPKKESDSATPGS